MKRQAIITMLVGTLFVIAGAYFAISSAEAKSGVPWWSFLLFFVGIFIIPIGYAMFKIKKVRVHEKEDVEVVIVPPKKKDNK